MHSGGPAICVLTCFLIAWDSWRPSDTQKATSNTPMPSDTTDVARVLQSRTPDPLPCISQAKVTQAVTLTRLRLAPAHSVSRQGPVGRHALAKDVLGAWPAPWGEEGWLGSEGKSKFVYPTQVSNSAPSVKASFFLRGMYFRFRVGGWLGLGRVLPSGGDSAYPKNCNYCIQLYPKLQKCVSHVYPNFQACVSHVYPNWLELCVQYHCLKVAVNN
mmetsp:Transcript_28241/g.45403  ORF Transcript_28241/g.45403 Transcript_28241/m.45403 type:complete len:215 (-) Transcript_28241:361-1005(-)